MQITLLHRQSDKTTKQTAAAIRALKTYKIKTLAPLGRAFDPQCVALKVCNISMGGNLLRNAVTKAMNLELKKS